MIPIEGMYILELQLALDYNFNLERKIHAFRLTTPGERVIHLMELTVSEREYISENRSRFSNSFNFVKKMRKPCHRVFSFFGFNPLGKK